MGLKTFLECLCWFWFLDFTSMLWSDIRINKYSTNGYSNTCLRLRRPWIRRQHDPSTVWFMDSVVHEQFERFEGHEIERYDKFRKSLIKALMLVMVLMLVSILLERPIHILLCYRLLHCCSN